MAFCPFCKQEINEVTAVYREVRHVEVTAKVRLDPTNHNLSYKEEEIGTLEVVDVEGDEEFSCPKCRETLPLNSEELEQFLEGKLLLVKESEVKVKDSFALFKGMVYKIRDRLTSSFKNVEDLLFLEVLDDEIVEAILSANFF